MAKKIDKDFGNDTRIENASYVKKNETTEETRPNSEVPPSPHREEPLINETKESKNENKSAENLGNTSENINIPPPRDEFKEKFDEYFKGIDNMIAGQTVVNIVDDLKANFLMIHAKKRGLDMDKKLFLMDPKAKEFCAFLVDHSIKGKIFEWVKKYPVIGAAGVLGISAASSYMLIEAMGKSKDEAESNKRKAEQAEEEIENLKRELAKHTEKSEGKKESGDIVGDTIKNL